MNLFCVIAPFIADGIQHFDVSEENMFTVGLLLKALFPEDEMQDEFDPNQVDEEHAAEQIMVYFLYPIRDVLDYAGFIGKNSAKMAARQLKMALTKFERLTEKSQQFTKIQVILEQ